MSDTADLVHNVRQSLAGSYDVLGYIGADGAGAQVILGRDLASNALVGISVTVDPADATQYSVDIQRTLGKTMTVAGSMCPECRTPLPELDAFCFHCGANLSGSSAAAGTPESAVVLEALAAATAGRYEILGRLDREGSTGAVYFARDLEQDCIAALRLKRVDASAAAQPEYVQKLSQIFDTGALQAKIAQRKAQQAEAAAAERAAAERVAAERAAAERATAERAAAERRAAERAAVERAAMERAAAEREANERIAADRAVAERAAASYSAPVAEFALQQGNEPVAQQFAQYESASASDGVAPAPKKAGSTRTPLIGAGVLALVGVLGYFAFSGASDSPPTPAANATADVKPSAVAPVRTDSVPPAPTTTPPAGSAVAATTAPLPAPTGTATDSGTIRVGELPADARIVVDGRTMRGRTLRVTARPHQLTVTAKGFEPFTEKLTVASGATVRWAPKLVAVVASNATTPNASAPPPAPSTPTTVAKKTCRELVRVEDWSSAFETCTTEGNAGNGFAASSVGRMYSKGLGTTRDAGAAVNWYRKGAAGGDHEAQTFMGIALRDGNGVKRDERAATEMFKLAAEGGERVAQLEYAVALEKGDGVNKNQSAAREWYRKSADQGVFMAARRLARMLEKGDGGPKSEAEALAAYERAATLGDAESAMTAGKWYKDGRGAARSNAQALIWFKKAQELGHKDAQDEIKKLQK